LGAEKIKCEGYSRRSATATNLNGGNSFDKFLLGEGFQAAVDDGLMKIRFRLEVLRPYP